MSGFMFAHKGKAHLWGDGDTLCTMWSTGGIQRRDRYGWVERLPLGREVCQHCETKLWDIYPPAPYPSGSQSQKSNRRTLAPSSVAPNKK